MARVIAGPRPMTTPAERAQVYFANAILPAPLPTPPRSKMLPLLPTPCLVLLPMSPPPKPSRTDADERWDARKNAAEAAPSVSVPCRADADERWDARKNAAKAAPSMSLPCRADAAERWDAHKVKPARSTSASSSSSTSSREYSSSQKWNSNKKRATSRAASAERWDAQKQPRSPQARKIDDDGSSTGSNDMELDTSPQQAFYAGSGFIVSPEPGMLPMPSSFMVRVA